MQKPPSKPLKFRQKVYLVGFSLILLLLLEGILRVFGIGGHPSLFTPILRKPDGQKMLLTNPSVQSIFFQWRKKGIQPTDGGLIIDSILQPKPKNVLRIFFIGESTVQGFPYPKTLCSPAFLEKILQQALPDKKVEVINLGVTAVASYPVWKISRQGLSYDPDLIIVYAGHNEYFGAFGTASLQSVGVSERQMNAIYTLRGLGLYQGINRIIDFLNSPPEKSDIRKDLIEIMAKTESIPMNSSLRERSLHNLKQQLENIIHNTKKKNIPIVLCTLVSNERTMVPIRSQEPKFNDPEKEKQWKSNFESGIEALKMRKPEAVNLFDTVCRLFPENGLSHYYHAQSLELKGDTTQALQEYKLGRDLDEMPWRAAETTNIMIRNLTKAENVWLADIENQFEKTEPLGNSWRLMTDHVHPSLEGQVLMAQTIFDTLKSHHWSMLDESTVQLLTNWKEFAKQQGYNRMKEYEIALNMLSLWNRPPMNAHNEKALQYYSKLVQSIESTLNPYEKMAIQRWYTESKTSGYQPDICMFVGDCYFENNLLPQALEYFQTAYRQGKDFTTYKLHLGLNILLCSKGINNKLSGKEIQWAKENLNDAKIQENIGLPKSEKGEFYRVCGGIYQQINEDEQALVYFKKSLPYCQGQSRQQVAVNMAQSYQNLNQMENAIKILLQERNSGPWDGPDRLLRAIQSGRLPKP